MYTWTHNRAGQILSEASTITGDASNGTVTYAYDPLERLTGSTLSGTTTAYGWDEVPNRTSVQVGAGTPATTTYDAANRPSGGANPTAGYSNDDDGRLTAAPDYQYSWDDLGRLTQVKNGGGTVLATYTYDPLDRLRMADYGGGTRVRFRYTGLTTSAAQWLDDAAGTVTRSIANGWLGERLADWTGAGSNLRIYGTNGHHDVTWLASSTGTVSQALRYDPWGVPRAAVPSGYTPFRFQGAWFDATTSLNWVITRWYAPSLARFISEDTLLGDPTDPPSRHLYAYAAGEPVARWDPDGRAYKQPKVSFANNLPDATGGYGGGKAYSNTVGSLKMRADTGLALFTPRESKRWARITSTAIRYTGRSTTYSTPRTVSIDLTANWKWWADGQIVAGGSLHVVAVDAHIIDTSTGKVVAGGRFETASVGCLSVVTISSQCNTSFESDETYTLRNSYSSRAMYRDHKWAVRVTATAWVRAVQGWASADLSLTGLAAKIGWYE